MRQATVGSAHRRDSSATGTLPAILEDGNDSSPPIPAKAQHRPATSRFVVGDQGHDLFDSSPSPPAYSALSGIVGPNGEKLEEVRENRFLNNKHIAKRGGWRRLCFIAVIAIICIVGLVVGLVVGLKKKHHQTDGSDSSSGGSSSSNPGFNTTFPAGSYAIETVLDSVSTNCTSNSATWRCYPYSIYSESTSASAATFDWIIQPFSDGSNNYTISSTDNPFSLVFANASLTLQDAGQSSERYTFQVEMKKPVVPATSITNDNTAATCYFNSTTFEASLYTRMTKSYPPNSTDSRNSTAFVPWPYAVQIEQLASSGSTVPECFDSANNPVGNFSVEQSGKVCNCLYLNYGT